MKSIHDSHEPPDFSLVLGGPLFQLLMRSRLTTPALDLVKRRIVFISLFAWLPLLLLSLSMAKRGELSDFRSYMIWKRRPVFW